MDLIPASQADEPVLSNLLELYSHDFSEFVDLQLGEDGRFGYSRLTDYWRDPARYPFLVRVDDRLAGFALIRRAAAELNQAGYWDVAEFFIVRAVRGRGVGERVAHRLWRAFEGAWQVRVRESNVPGVGFWSRTIASFTGASVEPSRSVHAGALWRVFQFHSPPH